MNDNVMHRGWTEGFTMFLLALQTGIIELKSTQRIFLLSVVLFIVLSSLIQSMYEIADPILLALGASQNKSWFKHIRAITLCTFLWLFPLFMTYIICQFFDLDFWLLAVISSCVLTSLQVLGSMVVYALFVYDTIRQEPWDALDDVVYYAKATTRVLEFIVAVFVVCYGVKESLIGEWSWINSSILIIHCYFNVWQRLQSGWKSYLLRREAADKIESLPLATPEQLSEHDDVCAICFQDMSIARVTPCKHIFHGLCLKKWLYVQENCPMCHQNISMKQEHENQTAEGDNSQNNENGNQGENGDNVHVPDNDGDGHQGAAAVGTNIEGAGPSGQTMDNREGDALSLLAKRNHTHNQDTVENNQGQGDSSSQGSTHQVTHPPDGAINNATVNGVTSKEMIHMAL